MIRYLADVTATVWFACAAVSLAIVAVTFLLGFETGRRRRDRSYTGGLAAGKRIARGGGPRTNPSCCTTTRAAQRAETTELLCRNFDRSIEVTRLVPVIPSDLNGEHL